MNEEYLKAFQDTRDYYLSKFEKLFEEFIYDMEIEINKVIEK
jgi:hypothetical protein